MSKTKAILIAVVALIATIWFTEWFLTTRFPYQGEAYIKGYGFLLREDMGKALFFIVARYLLSFTSLSFIVFAACNLNPIVFRIVSAIAFSIVACLLIFVFFGADSFTSRWHGNKERYLDIIMQWTSTLLGLFAGYALARVNAKKFRFRKTH